MKRILLVFAFLALLPIGCHPQQGDQSSWDKYQPRTLQSIIDAHQDGLREFESDPSGYRNRLLLSSDSFQSKITLVFLGKSRPLLGKRAELLEYWKKMSKRSDDLISVFGTEMLFKEGDKEIWIAVQKPLLDPLPREVAIGKSFTAYIIWMGAIQDGNHWEWLFAMNEFDAPRDESTPRKPQE
jgi:hypothetical protein